ncbi:NADPH-dependent glutamate synthase [Anaerococcus sp. AGMB00486]|uniref:NADPH-dependent glutamate synthase n=2 Tax=Anaerococcus TaxID=165779 RepID=A0ABX2N8B7_9FIRM|nr:MULTISPECIES: NADPH-dependent glutamate synthase [Anaerococcus]MDY3006415.1 NADPH-dependent glutamate synthase [Anaerococcus porci]MSS77273.1 NADPH-dependent glutamate synthase [Anaerococcus porci]NVF10924.1 NADPH-dependent glutamate synthase [Anaerococcus faecalis]
MAKFNMSKTKVPMPEQNPSVRNKNFEEVALGYDLEMAQEEAQRCVQCKNKPCVGGCPVSVRIPEFIHQVVEGNLDKAYEIIASTNNLPAICGRVCPQENQCEGVCTRAKNGEAVAIGRLERFVADYHMNKDYNKPVEVTGQNKKVAVVGSGPSGLSCAADLAKLGYKVTLFEAFHTAGGVLMYGIPEFRLPKTLVQKELKNVIGLGVKLQRNTIIGRTKEINELFEEGYEAVYISTGAGLPKFLGIEGENLNGVYSANEFLTRMNLMKAYKFPEYDTPVHIGKKVCVVGGGNVAMDAARSAKRMGADVTVVYRRSFEEMPARAEESHHAKEEGINFMNLHNPVEIEGENGWVKKVKLEIMELGEEDKSGRRRPIPTGKYEEVDFDSVIISIGQSPNPLIKQTNDDIETESWGGIIIDDSTMTTKDGVFAGGDAVSGAATVILAMGAGKKAAENIDKYIKNKENK